MKRTMEVEAKVPMIPNFILVGKETVSISDFSEKELREIGAEWTEELIKKAKRRGIK